MLNVLAPDNNTAKTQTSTSTLHKNLFPSFFALAEKSVKQKKKEEEEGNRDTDTTPPEVWLLHSISISISILLYLVVKFTAQTVDSAAP